MYTKISISVLLLISCTVAYPRTYQEQRQIYYTQPLPVHQRLAAAPQVYVHQQPLLQVPASTSLLPNNVNSGVRYGQHQVLYVVPSGAQVYYEEQGTGEEGSTSGGGGYGQTVIDFISGVSNYFPFGGESGAEKPVEGGGATGGAAAEEGTTVEKAEETPQKPEKPEKLEQASGVENLVGVPEQLQQGASLQQALRLPIQQQLFQQQKYQTQQQLQQQSLENYLALRNQQLLASGHGLPSNKLLYYKNVPQTFTADYNKKPGAAAIAFQRYLTKAHENHVQSTTTEKEGNENEENSTPEGEPSPAEDLGPSIAQAKPQAVSVAGPGGVAAAAPVGTAVVGAGGMALSAPQATAVAGTKPKPNVNNDKVRTYFPRNSAAAAFYPY